MRVRSFSDYGRQFTRFGFVNCYLVRESDSFTLIDTTVPGGAKKIIDAARAIAQEPIARLLLTHAHGDHIGSLDALARALGQVQVTISGFGPRRFPFTPLVTWHRPTAVASARRLLELPIRRYAAGHGRIVEGGPELLERAVLAAEARLR